MRLEGEKKAIEKKLEELKAAIRKTAEKGSRLEQAEPSTWSLLKAEFSKYLPSRKDSPAKLESKKRVVEDKFVIKEISGPVYRFKESRSRLLLRKKASEKAVKRDDSADNAEISTAPTQRTNVVYVPLEDSFDEAALQDLHHQPTKENSVPHIRSGTPF